MPDKPYPFSKTAEELIGELRRLPTREPVRQRKRPTKGISVLIDQLIDRYQIGQDAPEHTIREQWTHIVGAANAQYSHPARIDRARLYVLTSHAVVRQELFHNRAIIIARIQKLPGCKSVRQLNISSG